ncbi:mitochondrial 37S ribosomal protein uS10m KNAG_0H01190 [Huiozyma naganishii CBS 8797]|uniref:Small ribosomal subunit protein uS10m n=1 Tax=Huiozyma naganishii (strain ATCC MYA-139 / BCRC 22969 / CBS 8797 / KCTC 17520 / NBRC 10181 / NCYC 3082 / Yp74L-3) TaxID=1071383 RepID=J7S1N4_HUIN7|nr:hypothetical protein KNAG_0H01190 [Kazachstania naganishii CBS 8797]CCK71532.1 hypothetical protein KNAG_0H01190 [Kazachstania naganishii CBS 8797]
MLRRSILGTFTRLQSTIAKPSALGGVGAAESSVIPPTVPNVGNQSQKTEESTIPLTVKALDYVPTRIPVKHGHLIADIQLRSYETSNLKFYIDFIQRAAFYLGVPMTGPKPLPTRRERWTVIRSPFAQAKSKENFERSTHKRLLRVWDTNSEVLEMLLAYITKHSVAGVGMKCNVFKREPLKADFDSVDLPQHDTDAVENDLVNRKIMELLNSETPKK